MGPSGALNQGCYPLRRTKRPGPLPTPGGGGRGQSRPRPGQRGQANSGPAKPRSSPRGSRPPAHSGRPASRGPEFRPRGPRRRRLPGCLEPGRRSGPAPPSERGDRPASGRVAAPAALPLPTRQPRLNAPPPAAPQLPGRPRLGRAARAVTCSSRPPGSARPLRSAAAPPRALAGSGESKGPGARRVLRGSRRPRLPRGCTRVLPALDPQALPTPLQGPFQKECTPARPPRRGGDVLPNLLPSGARRLLQVLCALLPLEPAPPTLKAFPNPGGLLHLPTDTPPSPKELWVLALLCDSGRGTAVSDLAPPSAE